MRDYGLAEVMSGYPKMTRNQKYAQSSTHPSSQRGAAQGGGGYSRTDFSVIEPLRTFIVILLYLFLTIFKFGFGQKAN